MGSGASAAAPRNDFRCCPACRTADYVWFWYGLENLCGQAGRCSCWTAAQLLHAHRDRQQRPAAERCGSTATEPKQASSFCTSCGFTERPACVVASGRSMAAQRLRRRHQAVKPGTQAELKCQIAGQMSVRRLLHVTPAGPQVTSAKPLLASSSKAGF